MDPVASPSATMAHEDDLPDFSYAFASAPSWNPAFRPDHDSPRKPAFDHSQLGVAPQGALDSNVPSYSQEEEDELPSIDNSQTESVSWTTRPHLLDKEPASDDSFFDRYGEQEQPHTDFPEVQNQDIHQAWEALKEGPAAAGETVPFDREDMHEDSLAEDAPEQTELPTAFVPQSSSEDIDGWSEPPPNQDYDYQGEATTLDEAVQESPESPLVGSPMEEPESPLLKDVSVATQQWGAPDDWELGAQEEVPSAELPQELEPQSDHWDVLTANMGKHDHVSASSAKPATTQSLSNMGDATNSYVAHLPVAKPVDMAWGSSEDVGFDFGPNPVPAASKSLEIEDVTSSQVTAQPVEKEAGIDWSASEDAGFDFGASAGSTTTKFLETQDVKSAHVAVQPVEKEADIDWGASENADFDFGMVTEPSSGMPVQTGADKPQEEDISAMWSAALDDEEFLADPVAAEAFGFEVDDGVDFLADALIQANAGLGITESSQQTHTRNISAKYIPATAQQAPAPAAPSNPYLPQGPQFTDLSGQKQQRVVSRGPVVSPYQSPYLQQPTQRPELTSSAQSFADKAKGGYHSPYDLPEDLTIKRRRPVHHVPATPLGQPAQQQAPPPPRLSSMKSTSALPSSSPQSHLASYSTNFTPPSSSHSAQLPNGSFVESPTSAPAETTRPPRPASTGFFEDLPVSHRPARHANPSGRYTPQIGGVATPPPQALPIHPGPPPTGPPLTRPMSYQQPPTQYPPIQQQAPLVAPQLQAPARMPLYAEEQHSPSHTGIPSAPIVSSRYSPSIPAAGGMSNQGPHASLPPPPPLAAAVSRYSPAPGSKPQAPIQTRYSAEPPPPTSRSQSMPYAPRTSSPLAHHSIHSTPHHTPSTSGGFPDRGENGVYLESSHQGRLSVERIPASVSQPALGTVAENEPYGAPSSRPEAPSQFPVSSRTSTTPPPSRSVPSSVVSSPRKRSSYAPSSYQPAAPPSEVGFAPPRRSQTSSPGASLKNPRLAMTNIDRPSSAQGPAAPLGMGAGSPMIGASLQRQPVSQEMNIAPPQDERAHDPLERWRGAPIFRFGIGNSVVTSFPKYIPRYGAGQMGPVMKPSQVEVRTRNINEISAPSESFQKFPGPLKKGKKKETLSWLKATTDAREAEHQRLSMQGEFTAATLQRSEERILLWKIMTLLVEHDGVLDGMPVVDEAVRKVISPATPGDNTTAHAFGITQTSPSSAQPEAFDPAGVNVLRNHLYSGEREKAVWYAVDQRLWAHALLIASTLNNKEIWKQVVQEFVRKEIRNLGDNTEALAALYQVFAGNWEESIDELVSVSARAGFQMVSTASGGSAQKDALAGLDRWRETLLLILNNRSPGDVQALMSLGKLLTGYGRIEAGHICFLFAKGAAVFSGIDDPLSAFSLVGGSIVTQGSDFGQDLDSILLSEVYEFALTSGSVPVPPIPHLQAFKLYHAEVLAETGRRTEAQQYCDAIAAAITSKSNRSAYHNQPLMQWVDEFNRRLSQAPADNSSSWKPSMDKVSTSLWGKFNNFIAGGEESDAASSGSGAVPAPEGQFARLAGGTPPLSRAGSTADMYGAYQPNGSAVPPAAGNSRYAPGNSAYAPRSSSEQQRPRYDPQAQSAYQPRTSQESTRSGFEPRPSIDSGIAPSVQRASSFNAYSTEPQYPPTASVLHPTANFSQSGSDIHTPMSSYSPNPYQPSPNLSTSAASHQQTSPSGHDQHTSNGYQPSPPVGSQDPSQSYGSLDEPSTSSYEPPSTLYEPPSYQSYIPDEPSWDQEESASPDDDKKPGKKSFMDDDDDDEIIRKAAELKKSQQKSQADREADEAFRKAAEADATKGNAQNAEKKGWFGGWFKKDPNLGPGPIKAKLGEENSFVYDENLKKWVNKKAGAAEATPTAATPPPPKASGPPSRPSSTFGPPPGHVPGSMLPPRSTSTPGVGPTPPGSSGLGTTPPMSRQSSNPMAPPAASALGPRPGSRPSSSMSNASQDADDIMGSLAPRARGAKKAPRKGRYVDVMANQK